MNPKENKIFLQLQGPKNKVGPNTLDASANGHLSAHDRVNISGYYLKVMIMAERYIKDQKPLRIYP